MRLPLGADVDTGLGTTEEAEASQQQPCAFDVAADVVVVTLVGRLGADRAADLWAALEEALQEAVGRPVVVDLTRVTGFHRYTIRALRCAARAAARRHDVFCVVMLPSSPIAQHIRGCGLHQMLSTYPTMHSALAS